MWFWQWLREWWYQAGWLGVKVVEVVVGKIREMGQLWQVGVVTMACCEKGIGVRVWTRKSPQGHGAGRAEEGEWWYDEREKGVSSLS